MTRERAIEIVESRQNWAKGDDSQPMPNMVDVYNAIELLLAQAKSSMGSVAKTIIIEELQENAYPEPVENVIFWALEAYDKSRVEHGNTWGRVCAGAIVLKIKESEAKAKLKLKRVEERNIMRYQVKICNSIIKVWDNKERKAITKPLPSMDIACEIADDFNKMANKDFTPLGLPDFKEALPEKHSPKWLLEKILSCGNQHGKALMYIIEFQNDLALDNGKLSLIDKVKEIAFGDGSAQERMEEIKALFSNEG